MSIPSRSLTRRFVTPRAAIPKGHAMGITVATWVAIVTLWSTATFGGLVSPLFLPSPAAVVDRAVTMFGDGSIWPNIWSSVEVVLIGFALSSAIAIPLGLATGAFKAVQAGVEPVANFVRTLPITAFVPLFILWIGIGLEQRVAIIFFGTFFQQLIMIADVVRAVPEDMINASYTLGSSRRDVLLHVLLPAAKPGIIDTLRVTMGWAWTYLVVAELVAASSGLGYMSMKAMRGFQVDVIFLAISIIGFLGLLSDRVFRVARWRFAGWAE